MLVDASALTAILKGEPERDRFVAEIGAAAAPITSAVSIFEAAIAFSTMTGSCVAAVSEVSRLLRALNVAVAPVDDSALIDIAIARDRYGKGSGHPAQLNLGDCISYGLAKKYGVRLLYKGRDFEQTDLA
jgi:ribonuclease VapC